MTCPKCDGNGCGVCPFYDVIEMLEAGTAPEEERGYLIEACKIPIVKEFGDLPQDIREQIMCVINPALAKNPACWLVDSQEGADEARGWVTDRLLNLEIGFTEDGNFIMLHDKGVIEFRVA